MNLLFVRVINGTANEGLRVLAVECGLRQSEDTFACYKDGRATALPETVR